MILICVIGFNQFLNMFTWLFKLKIKIKIVKTLNVVVFILLYVVVFFKLKFNLFKPNKMFALIECTTSAQEERLLLNRSVLLNSRRHNQSFQQNILKNICLVRQSDSYHYPSTTRLADD